MIQVEDKEGYINYMKKNSIGCGNFYPIPLHKQKAFFKLKAYENVLPVSERLCNCSVCLPIYPELTSNEVDYIIEKCNSY